MKKENCKDVNSFYCTPFREYIEAREPNNSYIDREVAEDGNFEAVFP
jgi:hypothetical protein